MPFFKNVFKSKDGPRSGSKAGKYDGDADHAAPPKPRWEESWTRKTVAPEEIQDLIHACTVEMKSRALDMPLMLLPFRPTSDTSASRNFVRSFFKASYDGTRQFRGANLTQEVRLIEPLTLCSILKWCWSRLPGGVVTWDAYELFRIGESDSNLARNAFDTFIPLSVDSDARKCIIFDFFDLLAAVAARSKTNGMGARKLSRLAGWWAFEFAEDGKGFDSGYRTWEKAADAASHLFFAYLRSLAPDPNIVGGISTLPRSLQSLLAQCEYPPEAPLLMQTRTTKVVMIVNSVSPTPFSLLRRAKNFEYRDDDAALQQFSDYDDSVKALTDECRRVLECIASANQSSISKDTTTPDPSWSRFEDFGFSGILEGSSSNVNGSTLSSTNRDFSTFGSNTRSNNTDFGRPTTPSWADFLSSGFADESSNAPPTTLLLPTDKLPPLGETARVHSSQSHMRNGQSDEDLEPGELASITKFDLDETFWWVWMISLASEETTDRKAAFGRCTLIETRIQGGKWLVMEEQVKGASSGPEEGAYIAEKKSKFSFTRRGRLGRRKSTGKKPPTAALNPYNTANGGFPMSKTSIAPDQHARIQAAAAKLAEKDRVDKETEQLAQRRARKDDTTSVKTNSVLTLQPHLLSEAGPAMKWDKRFGEGASDRDALRAQYLGDVTAGKGSRDNLLAAANGHVSPSPLSPELSNRELPALPKAELDPPSVPREKSRSPAPSAPRSSPPVESSSATRVPWPSDSPVATPVPDGEPFPPAAPIGEHPALRQAAPERKPVVSPQSKPRESAEGGLQRKESKRLKKKDGGGLRKLFGRKKTDGPATVAEVSPPAAAKDEKFLSAPDAGRSPSRTEAREPSLREVSPSPSPSQKPQTLRAEVVPTPSPAHQPSPAPSSIQQTDRPSPPVVAKGLPQPEAPAPAYSQFGQGPMEDMPAFVPDDSEDDESPPPPRVTRRPVASQVEPPSPVTPIQHIAHTRDDVSEASVDSYNAPLPPQDRWAQIRKNAAERAAKLSEDQSRRSRSQSQSQRTDEGETSGEETIESRVARIKARVAELTANADTQAPASSTLVR